MQRITGLITILLSFSAFSQQVNLSGSITDSNQNAPYNSVVALLTR
jgi:hypothetical protein